MSIRSFSLTGISVLVLAGCAKEPPPANQSTSSVPELSLQQPRSPTPAVHGQHEPDGRLQNRITRANEEDAPHVGLNAGRNWPNDNYYESYDSETLIALAEYGDAQAAAQLFVRVYNDSPQDGQMYAVTAAALSAKPDPLIEMLDSHLDYGQAREALPYAIVAGRLGSHLAWLQAKAYIEQGQLSAQEIHDSKREADELYELMEQIRLERIGVRFNEN